MTTHEVLVAARNLIDREGWVPLGSDKGPRCVGLAIAAAGDYRCDYGATRAFVAANNLQPRNPDSVSSERNAIYRWNDSACGSKEEALAALDRAIAWTAPPPEWPEPHLVGCLSNAELDALKEPA